MKYLEEIEKTEKKIEELLEHLKAVKAAQKLEEEKEMVKSIRSMKLAPKELLELLTGIQTGAVNMEMISELEKTESAEAVNEKEEFSQIVESEEDIYETKKNEKRF